MNFTEITDTALSYADREDTDVTSRIDKFLLMTEARINKKLKVTDMSARALIDLAAGAAGQVVFALPSDFGGLRSIKVDNVGGRQCTLTYVNPEQLANRISLGELGFNRANQRIYYNIVAKELHLYPNPDAGNLEITYYQKVPALTVAAPNNWISDDNPECYIFGLLVEITAFAKDADAFAIWQGRFNESIIDMEFDDSITRWSGTPLVVHVG